MSVAFLLFAAAVTLTAAPDVVDGDTFDAGGVRYRIEALDAPELSGARCPAERAAGERAKAALAQLLKARPVTVEVSRIQPARGYLPERAIARVTAGGQDVRAAMIAGGHGLPWRGRTRNWCRVLAGPSPG